MYWRRLQRAIPSLRNHVEVLAVEMGCEVDVFRATLRNA
jgi:hypothetical protein